MAGGREEERRAPAWDQWWRGLALVALIAAAATLVAQMAWAREIGFSALTLGIVLGIVAGNSFFPPIAARTAAGVDFSKNALLRVGIILYGWRITFHDITTVGWTGVLIDVVMIALTFTLAVQLGTRVFRLDRRTAMLIGSGSAICGAAAVLAAEPVIRGQANRVSVAVATVVVFGTLGMFIYPALYPHLGMSEQAYGVYAGSTIHEVAQVVVAARSVGDGAASIAVFEKMLRVMLLAPFLLLLSAAECRSGGAEYVGGSARRIVRLVPWFAVLFIAACALNSLHVLPGSWAEAISGIDTLILSMAMVALGLRTHVGAIRQAGVRPLLLAMTLFAFLIVGGYGVNRLITTILG